MKQVTGTNLQGWLAGNGDVSSPTIAIVANYDALAASSSLSKSAKSSSTSTVMLLELSRLYNRLYSQSRTQSNYNILFVLTTGGHFNFYGSKQWLNQLDERLVKSLEFVICLDSLGEGTYNEDITMFHSNCFVLFYVTLDSDSLYLHTSRPERDEKAKRLYDVRFDMVFHKEIIVIDELFFFI